MEARALGRLGSRAAGEPRSPGLAAGRGRLDAAQFSRDGRGMIQGLGVSRSKDTTQEWRRCPYMWGAPAKCPGGSGEPKVSDAVPRAQESRASPRRCAESEGVCSSGPAEPESGPGPPGCAGLGVRAWTPALLAPLPPDASDARARMAEGRQASSRWAARPQASPRLAGVRGCEGEAVVRPGGCPAPWASGGPKEALKWPTSEKDPKAPAGDPRSALGVVKR